jgi:hypothetical protein
MSDGSRYASQYQVHWWARLVLPALRLQCYQPHRLWMLSKQNLNIRAGILSLECH